MPQTTAGNGSASGEATPEEVSKLVADARDEIRAEAQATWNEGVESAATFLVEKDELLAAAVKTTRREIIKALRDGDRDALNVHATRVAKRRVKR